MIETIKQLPEILRNWIKPNLELHWQTKQILVWFMALNAGVMVAFGTIMFREFILFIQYLWVGTSSESILEIIANAPWYLVFVGPVLGGLLVGICLEKIVPGKRTFGVADVIEVKTHGSKPIAILPALSSALVTSISLGAGASTGREGPVVHLGAAISSYLGAKFNLPNWGAKTLLGCGVAAAVSASFNAPIAGVLFAHEVVLGHYAKRAIIPIIIASVSSTIVTRFWFGDVAAFTIPNYQVTSNWEFPAFALLGVVCAFVAVIFQFSLVGTDYVTRNIKIPLWLRPAIGGLAIGTIALAFPHVLGVGYEATDMALKSQLPLMMLLGLLVAKTAATAISMASRFGGGIFSPALYLGAMAGGAFGLIAAQVFPEMASSQGLYAILGMGAVAAAVLGAPISTTMIVFELTGGYTLSLALLLTVSIAYGISNAIHGHSFFEWQLEMRGLFVQDGPHRSLLRVTTVENFMSPLDENEKNLRFDPNIGSISLTPSTTLERALRTFDNGGHASLPVVDEKDETKIIGWAHQSQALRFFNNALIEASEEEHQH
ncbi:MAG: chloride channel protein [Rhizobiales bacterium]|nr:chloride channel protein [Hyphomicrobiales bacterium]